MRETERMAAAVAAAIGTSKAWAGGAGAHGPVLLLLAECIPRPAFRPSAC